MRDSINSQKKRDRAREDKVNERKNLLFEKHRLMELVDRKQEEFELAERKFKRFYLTFRILVVALWVFIIYIFTIMIDISLFESLKIVNSVGIFLLVVFNFVAFDRVLDFKEILGEVKERLINILFNKSFRLKDDIFEYNSALDKVESKLEEIDRELAKLSEV